MSKLNLTMIVTGFPSAENMSHGIFNKRAADQLSNLVNLTVIQLRIWKPGRKFISEGNSELYKHYIISAPYIPFKENKFLSIPIILYNRLASGKLKQVLEETQVFHSVGASFSGALGALWSEKYNKAHVLQIIGTDVNTELPLLVDQPYFKRIKTHTQGVGCNSRALMVQYEKLMGKIENIEVIYRGIDLSHFHFQENVSTENLRFLYLGGIPDYRETQYGINLKGGVTLMDAWINIDDKLKSSNCELVFAGPDSDTKIAADWKDQLSSRIILGGNLSPTEVLNRYNDCHVVLIPSMEEGLPNVALEAGALGKCVIASDVGGLPELIENNVSGLLVQPGSVTDLGNAILNLISNKNMVSQFGVNLRKTIESRFNSDAFAIGYLKLYEKAINGMN